MLEITKYIAVGKVKDADSYIAYNGNHWQICSTKNDILYHAKLYKVKAAAEKAAKAIQSKSSGFEGHVWEVKCTHNLKT